MLRKVISFIGFFLIICSMNTSVLAYDDVTESNHKEAIEFLSAQGVLSGYSDGSFKPMNNVTRAEFISMIIRIQNLDFHGDVNKTYYPDVLEGHWALSDINLATSQRLISGYDDGTFRPDSNITVTDSAKIILCLLGYGPSIESGEGYPNGYITEAKKIGILDGIQTQYNQFATRDDVALMLYNSLEINIYEKDGEKYRKTDKNILNSMLKLFERTGVITATKYAEITPVTSLLEDEIAVDNVIYKITDEFIQELVGYKITYYIKEIDDDFVITYYKVDKNQSVMVSPVDINYNDCSVSVFSYFDNNGKKRNLKLDTRYIIKNGTSVYIDDKSVFDIVDGNILLIDSDNDGDYETVFVNSMKTIVVGRINKVDKIIIDQFSSSKKLDLTDEDKTIVIRYNDEEINFADIVVGDIITYSESDSRTVAYISKKVISATVMTTNRDEYGFSIITSDQKEYKMSRECIAELDHSPEKKNALVPNAVIKLYLNVYNEVSQFEIDGLLEEKYAFLVTARYSEEDEAAILTMWPEGGSVQKFTIKEDVRLNDGDNSKKVTPIELVEKLVETRIISQDPYVNDPYFQLIKYTTGTGGTIRQIITAKSSPDGKPLRLNEVFTRDLLASSIKTNQKNIINGAYKLSENVKIFNIPPKHDDYSKYLDSITLSKNITATVALYDMNEGNIFDALLVINPNYDSYYDNSEYKPFFIYDHTVTTINDDNEIVYDVYGMSNRSMRSFRFDNDPQFNKGDIYQFLEVAETVAKANKIYDAATKKFAAGDALTNGLGIKGNVTDEVVLGVMEARYIDSNTLIVTNGAMELMLAISSSTRCTLNDNGEIRIADVSEISVGDKIAFRTFNGTAGDLVIIR